MIGYLLLVKWIVAVLFPVQTRLFLLVVVFFFIVSGALIYGVVLLRYGALMRKQLYYFPFASKLVQIYEKMRNNTYTYVWRMNMKRTNYVASLGYGGINPLTLRFYRY